MIVLNLPVDTLAQTQYDRQQTVSPAFYRVESLGQTAGATLAAGTTTNIVTIEAERWFLITGCVLGARDTSNTNPVRALTLEAVLPYGTGVVQKLYALDGVGADYASAWYRPASSILNVMVPPRTILRVRFFGIVAPQTVDVRGDVHGFLLSARYFPSSP